MLSSHATIPDNLEDLLPHGISSRIIPNVNGLDMHILEAPRAPDTANRPLILLLHGFPELSYSFRKIIEPLASKGYHVVAPDQRGYGRTTGWSASDGPSFSMLNLVTDVVALVLALRHRTVACVIGHDFGSPVAAYCALARPDIFRSAILMSAPFVGSPSFSQSLNTPIPSPEALSAELAALNPPRKHYQQYFASPTSHANRDMLQAPQGFSAFLRAYYHMKSADWVPNKPHPLTSWSAHVLAQMPEYYIMDADKTMADTVAPHLPDTEPPWLSDKELQVYTSEFSRTTFQGGLNWYQFSFSGRDLHLFSEKHITVPVQFIAGEKDWGMYQFPGGIERMKQVCDRMSPGGCFVVKGAGHWVQQERPEEVVRLIALFLEENSVAGVFESAG